MKQLEILKYNKILHLLDPNDLPDDFPGGGSGGGGDINPSGGGTGGTGSGTTSSVIIPTLSISPNIDQSVAIGTKRCITASGTISLPQEAERYAILDSGCAPTLGTGTWIKTCGTNPAPDAETVNTTLLYKYQPFHIVGSNGVFSTPGGSINNTDAQIGVKTTNGYYFYWDVMKYCNATPGNCGSNWLGYARIINPNGVGVTISGGLVEANQQFKVKSDGTRIIWEYTTYNRWVYNYCYVTIPEAGGDFQFYVNALFLGNTWTNLRTYRGSYQGTVKPEDFIWSTNCSDNLQINGNKACYTPTVPGACQVCVSTVNTQPKCINIVSSPLYIRPVNSNCIGCGESTDCANIPNPTQPIVTLSSTVSNSININWNDSLSFTNGLYYELDVNGDVQDVLDSSVVLSDLATGDYTISVRAIDACGESEWTSPQTITISASESEFLPPEDFTLNIIDDSNPTAIIYGASWTSSVGAVDYEIWVGDPQSSIILTTTLLNVTIGTLFTGLKLSVRAVDAFSNYSGFSNIEVVP